MASDGARLLPGRLHGAAKVAPVRAPRRQQDRRSLSQDDALASPSVRRPCRCFRRRGLGHSAALVGLLTPQARPKSDNPQMASDERQESQPPGPPGDVGFRSDAEIARARNAGLPGGFGFRSDAEIAAGRANPQTPSQESAPQTPSNHDLISSTPIARHLPSPRSTLSPVRAASVASQGAQPVAGVRSAAPHETSKTPPLQPQADRSAHREQGGSRHAAEHAY